ncbi:MAG: ATP-binding protein [Proteobacteria bacterium]|nr:ATP-binding protein [Pseudomonadota bacterium]
MAARALIEAKQYKLDNVLYLNFEDYRLVPLHNITNLDNVVQIFLKSLSSKGKKLLIFDEIQHVSGWDKLIRTLYEKERDLEIFLTGSNSELLSSEIGSNLAGRFIEFQILPFSFKEFLAYHQISIINQTDFYKHLTQIKAFFSQYLEFGGLPEIFTISNPSARYSYLQGIVSKVILDDVIERFNVRQPMIVEKILQYLHLSVGNVISTTRLSNIFKNQAISIKQETLATYIEYITKTFAVYSVDRFDWKLNRIFSTHRKYYSVDTGIINLFKNINQNYSKQLENIVFLKLKKNFQFVYYCEMNNKAIDFIAKDKFGQYHKFQVTTELSVENKDRELSPFLAADQYINSMQNILLTLKGEEQSFQINGTEITQKYLLKWLLDL